MATKSRTQAPRKTRRVAFLVFPDVVLLDLIGPWEVFVLANALAGQRTPPYNLELVSGADTRRFSPAVELC